MTPPTGGSSFICYLDMFMGPDLLEAYRDYLERMIDDSMDLVYIDDIVTDASPTVYEWLTDIPF